MKSSYTEQANNLAAAIDIAIKSFQTIPPNGFEEKDVRHIINVYEEWKNNALNPAPQFKKIQSLKYLINNAFTVFQESSGKTVDLFWQQIKENNLPYKRENKLIKILKRKRIKDEQEYDFVTDVVTPYQQEGLISEEEASLLHKFIGDFEQRKTKATKPQQ
jgi:hypothetical protein